MMKRKRILIKVFNFFLITYHLPLTTVFLSGCRTHHANQICFSNKCFNVEVVSSGIERERGLQFRTSLAHDAGMLFVFPDEEKYAFWMKDTLIPLDMIWMDYSHKVVYIASHVPPCKSDPCPVYTPTQKALYVLEINAGFAEKFGIKEGKTADFRLKE